MKVLVHVVVDVPDDVEDVEEYLNDVSFDCMTPEGVDIYDHIDGYYPIAE